MQNKSPIYDLIKELVGDTFDIYSYQNEAHFKKLWEFNSSFDKKAMLVVWDGIPQRTSSSVVDTSKYLTPIDWAVGYSLSIKKRIEQNTYPDLRILIFDDGSKSVSFSDSLKFVYQDCNKEIVSMPWIRIFSDIAAFSKTLNNLDPNVSVSLNQSNEDKMPKSWWKRIFPAKVPASARDTEKREETMPSMRDSFAEKTHDLESIKGIWAASITRPSTPGDHHALANLVGPLLLMEEGGDIHVNALQTLMRSIGLLPDCKKGDEDAKALLGVTCSWIDWQEPEWQLKLSELLRNCNDKLKLILIDDMFQISWGKILCRAVGVNYKEPFKGDGKDCLVKISECVTGKDENVVVKAASSAEWILGKLEKLGEKKDNRFEFLLDKGAGLEILFLDLRLYSGYFDKEVNFFNKLTALADSSFKEVSNKNLPWPGITNDEVERIQGWIEKLDKKQEDPVYVEALTLLPRLLALTDLSLPIILFSSTGRRDITEKLKPYKNIITVFEKPRFTVDIPFDIAWQTKCKFQDAMGKAFSILTGRQICRKVKKLADKAASCVSMVPTGDKVPEFSHIEIYIDESGDERGFNFSVGGLIMAYPKYKDVNELSEGLKKAGYYWYSDNKEDRNHLSKWPNEQNNKKDGACAKTTWKYEDARDKLLELCGKKFFISGICVWEEKNNRGTVKKTEHILLKDDQGNERYKRLLNILLELAIYEYIPLLINNKGKVTLSIFLGTRISELSAKDMFKGHTPDDYFGYGYGPNDTYYILGFSAIHPIVSSVLRSRDDLCKNLTLHHARGVQLQYGVPFEKEYENGKKILLNKPIFMTKNLGNREKYYVRRQHYFADQVLKPDGIKDEYEAVFNTGFFTKSDNNMGVLLDARKKLLVNNIAEGIVQAAKYTGTEVKDKMLGHLIGKIGESLKPENFEGSDFLYICNKEDVDEPVEIIPASRDCKIDNILNHNSPAEEKQLNNQSKVDAGTVNLNNKTVNEVTSQALEKAVIEQNRQRVTVIVEKIKDNGTRIICSEIGGEKRRILIEQLAKKASVIGEVSIGDIFDVTTYQKAGSLYGAYLIRREAR